MKAILVIDMPMRCAECPLLTSFDECQALKKPVPVENNLAYWDCPLKPMPQKHELKGTCPEEVLYDVGFNVCIDEILGDNR